jgi:hypothetical protein
MTIKFGSGVMLGGGTPSPLKLTAGTTANATLQSQSITSSGSWTVPFGIYSITVTVTGGGGGGAGASDNEEPLYTGGAGGAGQVVQQILTVSSGTLYTVTIGQGGSGGGVGYSGASGYPSSFGSITAAGGGGGSVGGGTYVSGSFEVQATVPGARAIGNGGPGGGYNEVTENGLPGSNGGNGSVLIRWYQ